MELWERLSALGRLEESLTLVKVFNVAIDGGVKLDDRFCGCLLSVASLSDESEDVAKVLACLQQANPKLVALVKLFEDEETSFETLKEEFRAVVSDAAIETRRPFCKCLIDICRKRDLHGRAHELLYLGILHGLYPDLHHKTVKEWSLNVRSLSVGAAQRGVARVIFS
uniref:Uncharacterized protein n=1 Tax=Populus trichocarpa TaxID=3694 RepID=B9MTZ9_POPTR